jgi:hypothetical protein
MNGVARTRMAEPTRPDTAWKATALQTTRGMRPNSSRPRASATYLTVARLRPNSNRAK